MNNAIIPFYKQIDKFIVKSSGCFLYDADNRPYIDFESGDWAANLGHANERINQKLKEQASILMHDGLRFRNKESEELSFHILEKLSLNDGKSAFLNSGSEGVNLGIAMAKNITRRNKIIKMDCSFLSSYGHGQISPNNPDLLTIPMDHTESIAQFDFREIAAFVFEPGNAWGLIKYPTPDFIASVALAVKQNGGLLMANEVTTGFGRTGKWFGFQHYDFQPDIVSFGKALGNGYPISGISISAEVAKRFEQSPFRYAQSHQNDPLGCAIGIEVIKIFEECDLVNQSFEKGQYFYDQLIALRSKHDKIKDVRARGLMIALEFDNVNRAENVYLQLIDHGFLVGCKEKVIRFMPPLIIEKTHIDSLIGAIDTLMIN